MDSFTTPTTPTTPTISMTSTIINTIISTSNNNSNKARSAALAPVLRSPKVWSSVNPRRSINNVRFDFNRNETRLYLPDGTSNKSSKNKAKRAATSAPPQSFSAGDSGEEATPELSTGYSLKHPDNVEDDDPMDVDEPLSPEAKAPLKRIASTAPSFARSSKRRKLDYLSIVPSAPSIIPCSVREWSQRVNDRWTPPGPHKRSPPSAFLPSSRPTKRSKMDSAIPNPSTEWTSVNPRRSAALDELDDPIGYLVSVRFSKRRKLKQSTLPTSISEWAKRTNQLFSPLLAVIIEDPEEEEEDDESHIDSSSLDGFNNDDAIASEGGPNIAALMKDPFPLRFDLEQWNGAIFDLAVIKKKRSKAKRPKLKRKAKAKRQNWTFTASFSVIVEHPEEEEDDDDIDIDIDIDSGESSFLTLAEDPINDVSNEEIAAPPRQSEIVAETDDDLSILATTDDDTSHASPILSIPEDGLGSGWRTSGDRYSLRLAKLLQDQKDASTAALGSGLTEEGRRFSRRVANRRISGAD
ncbi:unnamed protein product [Cylindrotheca closterium]|uniref:Uncharacterized protein n=1 Tax=Cylindrotheca closterium TaxID=2856 RepID=A0AAD2FEE2_9STRA|nr:unnamed protein product [Cylindrotheca closterium]